MALYDKPVRQLIRDMVSDFGLQKGQAFPRERVIAWFNKRYPRVKKGTISAHLIVMTTNAPSRIHHNVRPGDDLFFQVDSKHFRLYDAEADPAPIYPGQAKADIEAKGVARYEPEEAEELEEPSEFAYESDLRDFLAKNLNLLEPGLHLYEDEGITGIEFPAGGRLIDILAVDAQNNFVVIELKVSRGYDRAVGQLLRYMGWIGQNHAESNQKVRGVIVAREISRDLELATSRVSGVELYEYQLSVRLNKAQRRNGET
jgi:hypothetical protein